MTKAKSKTLSPESARYAGQFLVALSSLVVVTCAGAARAPATAASPAALETAAPATTPSNAPPEAAVAAVAPASTTEASASALALPRFRAALRELSEGRRADPVRVLWLGDSHAAADFWPDAVRKPLQERYGKGGPGFLHAGLSAYRHTGVKLERSGAWRAEPRQPSLWMRQQDGIFGLGGIRSVPMDATSRVVIEPAKELTRGGARWDLAYRLPNAKSRFRVRVDGVEPRIIEAKAPAGAVEHAEWETRPGASVTIDAGANEPELLGIIVESKDPGVVVDTLGINGARIGTPLAWEEQPWVDAVQRRRPSLVVIAYGTNEVGDQVAPHRYGPELEALVTRIRKAALDVECVVIGPTDRAAPNWTSLPRVADIDAVERQTAERVGCLYFSAWQSMGGDGSLKRWADQAPPLASSDHVHLTPRGYAELGASMNEALFGDGAAAGAHAAN